jgi:hypothetical protein
MLIYLLPILTDEGELFYVIGCVAHGLYFVLSGLATDIRLFCASVQGDEVQKLFEDQGWQ